MLAILSIFVEGWTVDAAVHVSELTEDRVLDLLDALAGHSLVSVDATDAGPRFHMLASVRELAAERLAASADLADVERRHAAYFGALVENADWPAERQAEWAERLRTEEENLRIAIRWFLTHDIAPLHTSSASSGCSGRCAIACRKAAPGSTSYGSEPTHWTTVPRPSCC